MTGTFIRGVSDSPCDSHKATRLKYWSEELVERQNIYLEILRLASDLGIDFAFPTQSLHVESFPGKDKVVRHNEQWSPSALKEEAKLFGPEGKSSKPKGLGIFVPPHLEKS